MVALSQIEMAVPWSSIGRCTSSVSTRAPRCLLMIVNGSGNRACSIPRAINTSAADRPMANSISIIARLDAQATAPGHFVESGLSFGRLQHLLQVAEHTQGDAVELV